MLRKVFDYNSGYSDFQKQAHEQFTTNEILFFAGVLAVAVAGQAIQADPDTFPRFLRHHLSNTVDVPLFASALNVINMKVSRSKSGAMVFAAMAASLGVYFEYEQYVSALDKSPDAIFDWLDSGLYTASGVSYGLWSSKRYKKNVKNVLPEIELK